MKNKEIQQRQIQVTETFDGENTFYIFDGIAWKMKIKESEADEFFSVWRQGLLNEKKKFNNNKPKLLINAS